MVSCYREPRQIMTCIKYILATISCLLLTSCAFMQGLRTQQTYKSTEGQEVNVSGGAPQASSSSTSSASETAASTISPITRFF